MPDYIPITAEALREVLAYCEDVAAHEGALPKHTGYLLRFAKALETAYAREEKREAEMEWYRKLKVVRDDDVTRIDGGETAQLLHEMWEENIRLKAEVKKRGLSREDVEDIFGDKMMNSVQQGAELLRRGNQIDTLRARVETLEKGLREVGCDIIQAQTSSIPKRQDEHLVSARSHIDAALPEKEEEKDA